MFERVFLQAISRLERWLDTQEWRGYEPHDALSTPLRPLLGRARLPLLVFKQVVMRSPFNIRPWLRIARETSPEAQGFFAKAYLRLAGAVGCSEYRSKAERMLSQLAARSEPGYSGACWGNQFDYITKFFYLPRGTPIAVWTSHNAHAFLDAYEMLGDTRYRDIGVSAANFVLKDLPRKPEANGLSISYIPGGYYPIHNASLLAASVLARVGRLLGKSQFLDIARQAIFHTVSCQRPDGAWYYGEAENLRWVDGFHSGYVLDCLHSYQVDSGDSSFEDSMLRGLDYYANRFFESDGTPRYYEHSRYPLDIQCAAQGIETLVRFSSFRPALLEQANAIGYWTIRQMQDPSGYFWFRRGPVFVNRVPMLHWGQATVMCALAGLVAYECRTKGNQAD